MTTLHLKPSMNRSPLRLGFLLIPLVLVCFGLLPIARAADGDLGKGNTNEGGNALSSLTTGIHNSALGFETLLSNTTGSYNTATGSQTLKNNTTGINNTAMGFQALVHNTTANDNTAAGWRALFHNTTGDGNVAIGKEALSQNTVAGTNTSDGANVAIGYRALRLENGTGVTSGGGNNAVGQEALESNTTGYWNNAYGYFALSSNTTGAYNTANGKEALFSNATGDLNTATGNRALYSNTTGSENTANGDGALIGNTTGSSNIGLGNGAGENLTTGNNNIDIGNLGVAAEGNTIRIGDSHQSATFIAGIANAAVTGSAVVVSSSGQLGVAPSSARFKQNIQAMGEASEAILALKPVTFHYKKALDPDATPQFGLVAEEVAKVNPDLVVRDEKGDIYTVRYDAVNAMLLNEFLKEHKTVQEQGATIGRLQKQIETLTAGLQKVSAQVEMNRPAPQVVNNNQ